MRILPLLTVSLLALAAVACGSDSETAGTPERLDDVNLETVTAAPADETTESLGVVRATTVSNLASKLIATVAETPVSEGDRVTAGQLVIRLDDRDVAAQRRKAMSGLDEVENAIAGAEAAVISATAQSDLATATWKRYVALQQRGSVSAQEFDEVEARYRAATAQTEQARRKLAEKRARREQANADLAVAEAALSWARLTSPIDGVVTARHIDVGSQAVPGMALLTIENPDTYRVETTLGEASLGKIHVGDVARVVVDAFGPILEGSVTHVSPALDPSSRTYLVKIDIPSHEALVTGLTARIRFRTGSRNVISIPSNSLVPRGNLTGVWIADDEGIARLRYVTTGRTLGDRIEVLSGLAEGDRIVNGTSSEMREGKQIGGQAPDTGSDE